MSQSRPRVKPWKSASDASFIVLSGEKYGGCNNEKVVIMKNAPLEINEIKVLKHE